MNLNLCVCVSHVSKMTAPRSIIILFSSFSSAKTVVPATSAVHPWITYPGRLKHVSQMSPQCPQDVLATSCRTSPGPIETRSPDVTTMPSGGACNVLHNVPMAYRKRFPVVTATSSGRSWNVVQNVLKLSREPYTFTFLERSERPLQDV